MLASFTFLLLSSNWSTCDILKERDGSVILVWALKVEILHSAITSTMSHKDMEHQDRVIVYWCLYRMESNFSENTQIWKTCLEFVPLVCISSSDCLWHGLHLKFLPLWEVKSFNPKYSSNHAQRTLLPLKSTFTKPEKARLQSKMLDNNSVLILFCFQ